MRSLIILLACCRFCRICCRHPIIKNFGGKVLNEKILVAVRSPLNSPPMQVTRYNKKRKYSDYKKRKPFLSDLKLTLSKWGKGIHQHVFKVSDTFVVTYNGATQFTGKAWSFALNDYSGKAALESLYDRYRISWIKSEFFPRQNSVSAADLTTSYTASPSLVSVVDKDDDTTPTAYADLLEFDSCKTHQFDKPFSRTFKPYAAVAAYSGTFTSYASSTSDMWFDVASPSIKFYGLKVGTFPYALGNNGDAPAWDVIHTFYVEFKHTR